MDKIDIRLDTRQKKTTITFATTTKPDPAFLIVALKMLVEAITGAENPTIKLSYQNHDTGDRWIRE
jgi:hypothetical protein